MEKISSDDRVGMWKKRCYSKNFKSWVFSWNFWKLRQKALLSELSGTFKSLG